MKRLSTKTREKFEAIRNRKRALAEAFASLSPEEKIAYIPHPGAPPSEFEVHAFLYARLQEHGYTVRGEVATRCGTCIFDLVIYKGLVPVRIIEVKKSRGGRRARAGQVERYAVFGVPVDSVCTLHDARAYIAKLLAEPL